MLRSRWFFMVFVWNVWNVWNVWCVWCACPARRDGSGVSRVSGVSGVLARLAETGLVCLVGLPNCRLPTNYCRLLTGSDTPRCSAVFGNTGTYSFTKGICR